MANIAATKSTVAPPAFDLTFDKGWLSFHHDRYWRIGELLGGDVAMIVATTSRFAIFVFTRIMPAGGTAPTADPARARLRPCVHSLPVCGLLTDASKTAGIQLASPELWLIAAGFQPLPALSAGGSRRLG